MATIDVEGGALWYDDRGDGRPLVCLHGAWMNSDAWRPQVERFAGEYRTITVDCRGHGQTGPTDLRRYSIERFADDVERLLDHLGVERPILCGISMGSMIAQEIIARDPDRVAGALLPGALRSMPPVEMPTAAKALYSPTPAIAGMLSVAGQRATFEWLLGSIRAVTGGEWLTLDPDVRAAALDDVAAMPKAEFRKTFDALYSYDPPDLTGVATPTLVVYGEREAPQVKRQGRGLVDALADGSIRELPDAAHLVNLDARAAFNEIAAEFLASVPEIEATA